MSHKEQEAEESLVRFLNPLYVMFFPVQSTARDVSVVQPSEATLMFLYREKAKLNVWLKGQFSCAQQHVEGLSLLKESIVVLLLMGGQYGASCMFDKPGRVRRRQDDKMCIASIRML